MADPTPQQLAKALTLNERMSEFGFDPSLKRGTLLPFGTNQQGEKEWAVPQIGYDMVKALILPGHVAQGGQWNENDVTDMALNIAGMGGFGSMGLGAKAVGGAGGKVLGANVYQGGPHKYGPEGAAQSLQHMSKGEGAQAYGWGRYDAGNPAVAANYRDGLSSRTSDIDGTVVGAGGDIDEAVSVWMQKSVGLPEEARALVADKLRSGLGANSILDDLTVDAFGSHRDSVGKILKNNPGHLYKHDLPDEDIARYMDWDKPLSEQSKEVQDFVRTMDPRLSYGTGPTKVKLQRFREGTEQPNTLATGQDLYRDLSNYGDHGQAASEALGKAGVPGLRYLDGGSRNAGAGSHNYVTWDQDVLNRMKLLERDGETFGMTGNPAMLVAGQNQDAGPSKMALELAKRLSDQEFYAKGGI